MSEPIQTAARIIYDFFMQKLDNNFYLVRFIISSALASAEIMQDPDEFFTQLAVYCRLLNIDPTELYLALVGVNCQKLLPEPQDLVDEEKELELIIVSQY